MAVICTNRRRRSAIACQGCLAATDTVVRHCDNQDAMRRFLSGWVRTLRRRSPAQGSHRRIRCRRALRRTSYRRRRADSPWWQRPVGSVTALATPPGHGWPPGLPPLPRRPRAAAIGAWRRWRPVMVVAARITAVTMTSHQPRTATPPTLQPFSHLVQHNTTATTDRDKVAPTELFALPDDVKSFVGIQNPGRPLGRSSTPDFPNGSINPAGAGRQLGVAFLAPTTWGPSSAFTG